MEALAYLPEALILTLAIALGIAWWAVRSAELDEEQAPLRPSYDPDPMTRRFLLEQAQLVTGSCAVCREERPLHPDDGVCGPCHYGTHLLARQPSLCDGELCDDCAFRPGSPERRPSERFLHLDCASELERVLKMAEDANGVFYCHKPFLEPEQEWGYDPESGKLVPLHGDHWRVCGGFERAWGKAIARDKINEALLMVLEHE